ncbi:hypothetical protein [Pseudoduganella aquatica]|uniref:hypothetical protein n=1 Tax=Pseudoduganella aquatica TaxID=2660641 RepID=UPI001E33EE20|nr:hypothetical protein [Pseudoduganella aquatica]
MRMTERQFIRFERCWRAIFTFFAAMLAAVLCAFNFGLVEGVGIFWCIVIGAISLIGAVFAAKELRDPQRREGVFEALETLGDD